MPITALSNLAPALVYLLLAALVVTRWRHRPGSTWMLIASLLTSAWAAYFAFLPWQVDGGGTITSGLLEVARNAGWYGLLLSILADLSGHTRLDRAAFRAPETKTLRIWIGFTLGFLIVVGVLLVLPAQRIDGLLLWQRLAILSMAVVGLILVEQVYRNTPPQRRWQIKLLCLGLGGIFVFDLFLYADLMLLQRLQSPVWQARSIVSAMVMPLLAVAFSRRLAQKGQPVISRQLLFHTTALMGCGLYLLAVGIASYFLHQLGGDLGALLQTVFLFAALLLLALVLFSGSMQARLRVFLAKHFFRYRYDYRQEWLRLTGMLSAEDQPMPFHERCIGAISQLVSSPGGILWVRRNDGQFHLEGALKLSAPQHPPESPSGSLVSFLDRTHWIIELAEYRHHRSLYGDLELPDWLAQNPRHWAVVPLLKGQALEGFVVLAQPRAPHQIEWEDRDLLKTAGRHLAAHIALVRTQEALLEARQFEAFHRIAAYLVHDLKNVSAQLSLICSNAERHRDNPEFIDDVFQTVANAHDRLERTQAHLRSARPPAEKAPPQTIALPELLREIITESQNERPAPTLDVRQPVTLKADREDLKNSIQHLVRNAQQATADTGWVRLTLDADHDWIKLLIEDNGVGMDQYFLRRRLFRPFQTTKGNAGMGIGLYEVHDYITRMGGRIDVQSQPGKGTLFTLQLPQTLRICH